MMATACGSAADGTCHPVPRLAIQARLLSSAPSISTVLRYDVAMVDNENKERKTCFVVMPVTTPAMYADHNSDPDHFAHILCELFIPALESLGYEVLQPSVTGSELIHAERIKNLEQADLVLCDLSSLNPNVFFELGIRTALDRPLVLVRDKLTAQIPFDLNAIHVLTYDGSLKSWIVKDEVARLVAHIAASAKGSSVKGNPMWRYYGLTKPASPAKIGDNPLEAKLDLIISELTRLPQRVASRPQLRIEERFQLLPPEVVGVMKQVHDVISSAGAGGSVDAVSFIPPGTIMIMALEGKVRGPLLAHLKNVVADASLTLKLEEWC